MNPFFKTGKIGFVFVAASCFLIIGCEKPKLKNAKAENESASKSEDGTMSEAGGKTPVSKKSKQVSDRKANGAPGVLRVVAEKRMPEPGEGVLPADAKNPKPATPSRALNIKYPLGRTLINFQGKDKTPSDIIGRDEESITILRKSDGKRIDIQIAELSTPDQTFVSFLPLRTPPPVKKVLPKPAYLILRERDLQAMKDQASFMRKDMARNRKHLIIVRGIKGRLKIMEGKIQEVEREISFYKATHGIVD